MKIFYRIADRQCQGLWYNKKGEFTGLIHNEFDFCKNSELQMPFDQNVVGFLSATDSLEELYNWFPKEDIAKLEEFGYFITIYESRDFKFNHNHWLISQKYSDVIDRVYLRNIEEIPSIIEEAHKMWSVKEFYLTHFNAVHPPKGVDILERDYTYRDLLGFAKAFAEVVLQESATDEPEEKVKDITTLDGIKEGDVLLITGDIFKNEPVTVKSVKVSERDGTEVIFDLKNNRFFNLGMYLEGKSWVKSIHKIIQNEEIK